MLTIGALDLFSKPFSISGKCGPNSLNFPFRTGRIVLHFWSKVKRSDRSAIGWAGEICFHRGLVVQIMSVCAYVHVCIGILSMDLCHSSWPSKEGSDWGGKEWMRLDEHLWAVLGYHDDRTTPQLGHTFQDNTDKDYVEHIC